MTSIPRSAPARSKHTKSASWGQILGGKSRGERGSWDEREHLQADPFKVIPRAPTRAGLVAGEAAGTVPAQGQAELGCPARSHPKLAGK